MTQFLWYDCTFKKKSTVPVTLTFDLSKIFIDNVIRISNFGMGVLHVKVKYWRIFCDVISLLAQVCILSSNRVSKEVSMTKI